ncbi:MAG: hypothetical protein JNL84_14240 [Candidatus Accumulibacter sp.]|nr:hypothetical protein [Accumulibacter sp.]
MQNEAESCKLLNKYSNFDVELAGSMPASSRRSLPGFNPQRSSLLIGFARQTLPADVS